MNKLLASTRSKALYGRLRASQGLPGTTTPGQVWEAVRSEITLCEVYTTTEPQVRNMINMRERQI
jgi:hypothetical protein